MLNVDSNLTEQEHDDGFETVKNRSKVKKVNWVRPLFPRDKEHRRK